ncbi:AraC family transcriptional regulator [Acerihabitans sp. KWT182]|uniref:AraC family transcriptional regulator n=1 Tax=Acerihabitans sp. KWT182 TaxID=3157919 RepID=A0AAU7QI24_9GAMM
MIDPLAEVVMLLQPSAGFSKSVVGAGPWAIRRSDAGEPFYCVVLEGACRLAADGHGPIELQCGDFALIPSVYGVAMSSQRPPQAGTETSHVELGAGRFRIGRQEGPIDFRMLAGHCSFASADSALLLSLLPRIMHVRGEPRLTTLVRLLREETREQRPARDIVLMRLMEVLLIEALRSTAGMAASPGLVHGLADSRLAASIRAMHERPAHAWTVAELAKEAALSRSAFFERFSRAVGMTPMLYLLTWRMAMAKDLLRRGAGSVAEVAERVGYSTASTFSVAFMRHIGMAPTRYAKAHRVTVS